ncbi:hypothetical protein [Candidatus Formimonas warabiya]|uniref:Uncharacterized protein n=1 Tax=Formimonas warabiya TaxID=1761012 RepID=A0A3G1KTK9_FORW1|nr:hypothetical protein [Candidatus Formimonas warabiya]ATW25801.1 hypothetical protein DCMF_14420 [Candidatus Formimonas warabiya]
MFDFTKYDFSKEARFRDELFNKMKKSYEKSQNRVIELSDDALNAVAAASEHFCKELCPFANIRCEDCENHIKIDSRTSCIRRYLKR